MKYLIIADDRNSDDLFHRHVEGASVEEALHNLLTEHMSDGFDEEEYQFLLSHLVTRTPLISEIYSEEGLIVIAQVPHEAAQSS